MSNNGASIHWPDTPAGRQVQAKLNEERTLEALHKLLDRLDAVEKAVENLSSLMQQGPGLMAMGADMLDEVYQKADARGVNIEERLKVALHLAEKLTDPYLAEKMDNLLKLANQLPGMVGMTADMLDEGMKNAIAGGVDPQALAQFALKTGQALSEAQAETPAQVGGIFGMLRLLKDPDRQRGLGFLMNFVKRLGQKIG
ncbi:MAG TPA: DUF1641 domain-containing protein [Saprospiraceae bacterium]|nr:DUF1641 domain-containing protein [Saprospiraceae bacterium]HMQ85693.1 DUF1641 domain-containing protein [Saprospiraceae bacterium]